MNAENTAPPRYVDLSAEEKLEHMTKQRNKLDGHLADVGNLVAALQIILWDFSQESVEGHMGERRDALVGIGNALDDVMKRSIP